MTIYDEACSSTLPRAEAIARLNDTLRKTGRGGTIMVTQGVLALKGFDRGSLSTALANFDGFNAGNDPHDERDFGKFRLFETNLFFKIDYYDSALKFGSDDPADASITHRVLTLMTAVDF